MFDVFRIHGDNVVECERIANLILAEVRPQEVTLSLLSPSTIAYTIKFHYGSRRFTWQLELFPGFNKAGRHRWDGNIFQALKDNGSFLDETPDAIVTSVTGNTETILLAVEFCSALQAGNQAWQRSGRAFSTGRTGCPYLYIVDFVKYELDPQTRVRKALRFPNPAVPYSYINFSKETGNFVAQVYVRSEEFDKRYDRALMGFDENNFADRELSAYIVKRMCGFDTSAEEYSILQKNLNVVLFLAQSSRSATNFTPAQWLELDASSHDIISYSLQNSQFNFHKTITAKGHHGQSPEFLSLVDTYSVGIASRDLPFGIIPANKRPIFASQLHHLYPSFDLNIIQKIGDPQNDLILCMIKGFKPRGDDNRPDRGILPLAAMLTSTDTEVMTYIYGPVIGSNLNLLLHSPLRLAEINGFWKSVISLSDYVALDVPVLRDSISDAEVLVDTSDMKTYYTENTYQDDSLERPAFSCVPLEYHEDDVDTGIHFIFAQLLASVCFEGMCNPPGGDWSGLSVLCNNFEVRWLSLPRVSEEVAGKRPDHVLQLFGVFKDKPVLLSIESKERSMNLEPGVGIGLINYIQHLMDFVPNVEREIRPVVGAWQQAQGLVRFEDFVTISAAAYLRAYAQSHDSVFYNSGCDMLFLMEPTRAGWNVEIVPNTQNASVLKQFIIDHVAQSGFGGITIY